MIRIYVVKIDHRVTFCASLAARVCAFVVLHTALDHIRRSFHVWHRCRPRERQGEFKTATSCPCYRRDFTTQPHSALIIRIRVIIIIKIINTTIYKAQ